MLNTLQACRAAAALLVVFYHTSHGIFRLPKYFDGKPFGPVFDFGFAGVDFFFVLSGFIIMHAHARDLGQPRLLGSYLWKRFSRVYPAYWVILAAIIPVYFLVPSFGFDYQRNPDVIVRAVFLLPHPEGHPVLGVAWTLVYEIFFYALFSVLILDKRIGIVVFAAWAGMVIAYPWYGSGTYPTSFLFSANHVRFLAGIGVALTIQRVQIPLPRLVAGVGLVLFLTTGMGDSFVGPLSHYEQMFGYTVGSVLMIAGLVQAETLGLIRPPRWLVYLGNASYAIYLVHFLALSVLAKAAKVAHVDSWLPATILFSLHVVGAVAIGCLFHHAVERPLHQRTKRFFRRPESVAPEPVPTNIEARRAA